MGYLGRAELDVTIVSRKLKTRCASTIIIAGWNDFCGSGHAQCGTTMGDPEDA